MNVFIAGSRSEVLSSRMRSLSVSDGIGHETDSAVLVVSAGRREALGVALPPLGAEISFSVARDGRQAVPLGDRLKTSGITGSTRDGTITIEASAIEPRSALNAQRGASYSGRSIGEITAIVAERAGLAPAVSAELAGIVPEGAIQAAESDRQFLFRLVGRFNGRWVVKDGRLVVLAAGETLSAKTGASLPALSVDLTEDGSWVRWRRADSEVRGSVSALVYGPDGSTLLTVTAGSGTPRRRLSGAWRSPDDALRAANRALLQARSSRDWIEIERELTPEARALYPLTASGLPEGFSGGLIIQQVRHIVGSQVARTVIQARS